MNLALTTRNVHEWFAHAEQYAGGLNPDYQRAVSQIWSLINKGDTDAVHRLAQHLRPWDIEVEGNWGGREWLRLVAMQALCYLGTQRSEILEDLTRIALSGEGEWKDYDENLRETWRKCSDVTCFPDPYEDFLRCIREVVECIQTSGNPPV